MAALEQVLTGDGSIATLDAAAPWRLVDARVLEAGGRGAAVYLYGYAVEIRQAASCYRIKGYAPEQTIQRSVRDDLERKARRQGVMSREPHDLLCWARLLVLIRKRERVGYDRRFGTEMIARVTELYDNWRPRLRYRAVSPTRSQVDLVRDAADWLDANYDRLES